MKRVYLTILVLLLINNISYAKEFKDIENHWAKVEIEESIENDIINGYGDNTFKPKEGVTLSEYLKIIIKSAKFDLVRVGSYWPDYFINTAKEKGLILDNEFSDYNKKLTRNEVARITSRYINVKDIKKSNSTLKDLNEEYKEEIQKLIKLNVITGYEDKTFRGENNVTRAEAVVIAKRATNERRKLISNRKYSDSEKINFSNIKTVDNDVGVDSVSAQKYKIENRKIHIYDSGRYSNLQGYEIKNDYINISKTIKVINNLIDEDSYTEVIYVPFSEVVNQLIIRCGENKNVISISGYDYEITYYENKLYELKRISKEDLFSEKCYMKIELCKMWRDFSKFNKKEYIDEYKKEKLKEVMKTEFGENNGNKILKYMLEKYEKKTNGETKEVEEKEQKRFGKYTVNYYKKENSNPIFYISKEE